MVIYIKFPPLYTKSKYQEIDGKMNFHFLFFFVFYIFVIIFKLKTIFTLLFIFSSFEYFRPHRYRIHSEVIIPGTGRRKPIVIREWIWQAVASN